jgi:hypothetical protein
MNILILADIRHRETGNLSVHPLLKDRDWPRSEFEDSFILECDHPAKFFDLFAIWGLVIHLCYKSGLVRQRIDARLPAPT